MITLKEFFTENPRAALALSGGVDSCYLLYAGLHYKADVQPYFIKSQFQPEFELDDAKRICEQLNVGLKIIHVDALASVCIANNPTDRCYHCKRMLFSTLREKAELDGYSLLIDGTNASDLADDRPGMLALAQMHVRSPLRECGLTKENIRALSRTAGLFVADKPSYACLATRISHNEPLTEKKLKDVERAEGILFDMGYSDLRVRSKCGTALLQFPKEQLSSAYAEEAAIRSKLGSMFRSVLIDPVGR